MYYCAIWHLPARPSCHVAATCLPHIEEAAELSTCNRMETYVVANCPTCV